MRIYSLFLIPLSLLLAVFAGCASAQQFDPAEPGDTSYFLAEASKVKVEGARLQGELAGLLRNLEADPNKAFRAEVQDILRFLSDLRRMRSEAERLAPAYLVRPLDWLAKSVENKLTAKTQELNARDQALAKERAEITRQIDAKRQELVVNSAVENTVNRKIQELRDERARASKAAELQGLQEEAEHAEPALAPNTGKKPTKRQQ